MPEDFYRPLPEKVPDVERDVVLPDPVRGGRYRIHITCEHLLYKQFSGLDDALIGEIRVIADPTGNQEMKARRVRLKRVLRKLSNLDPSIYPGGEISDKEGLEKWIDEPGNDNGVWASWAEYTNAIDNPPLKSASEDRGDRGGEDAGESEEAGPAALVPTVRRVRADGGGGGGEVSDGDGNGAVSEAGSSGVEAESYAGAGL